MNRYEVLLVNEEDVVLLDTRTKEVIYATRIMKGENEDDKSSTQ
jgi:hypothetical protein